MTMQLYSNYVDPLNNTYVGKAERAVFTFSLLPEQLDFINNFFASQYINECKNAVKQQSPTDDVLQLQVYRDTSPVWKTDYQLVITATDRTGNVLPWVAIVGLALISIAVVYFVVRPTLQSVTDLIYGPGGNGGGSGGGLVGMLPWIVIGFGLYLMLPEITARRKATSKKK